VNEPGQRRLAPATGIAGRVDRRTSRAVVRAVPRHDLLPAGERAGDLERVLVRFGAAVGEEKDVDVPGGDLRQLRAELRARLGRQKRVRVRQHGRLPGYRADDAI